MVFRAVRKTYYPQYHRSFAVGKEIVLDYDPTLPGPNGEPPENRHFVKISGPDPVPEVAAPSTNGLTKKQLIAKAKEQGVESDLKNLSRGELLALVEATEKMAEARSFDPDQPIEAPPPVQS
jgi:hypothetical protein